MFQRTPYDRRRRKSKTRFPIQDSNGKLVREDRRVQPDRRPAGIQAEWDEIIHDADRPAVSGSL